jgi:hypothetical protein
MRSFLKERSRNVIENKGSAFVFKGLLALTWVSHHLWANRREGRGFSPAKTAARWFVRPVPRAACGRKLLGEPDGGLSQRPDGGAEAPPFRARGVKSGLMART